MENADNQPEPDSDRTATGQRPDSERPHARIRQRTEDRGQRTEEEQKTLSLVEPVPKVADQLDELNAYYGSLPGCRAIRKRSGPLGRNLARLLELHGLEGARDALAWMAYAADCPKRLQLAEGGHDTLATIGREAHAEAYAVHWRRWVARGRRGEPRASAAPRLVNDFDHLYD